MKRLKIFFAVILLSLALPAWRLSDLVTVLSPFKLPIAFMVTFIFLLFVLVPLKLLIPKIKNYILVGAFIVFGILSLSVDSFSKMATKDSNFNHCGHLTYTGTFYPIRKILTDAHRDDLEARNQMCWVRKLISRVPAEGFDRDEDVVNYTKLIEARLLEPEIKYRSSLPIIAVLYFEISVASRRSNFASNIANSLHFWINHYTDEISNRDYSVWNWPHSSLIKFEYGLIEKNWEALINSMVLEN